MVRCAKDSGETKSRNIAQLPLSFKLPSLELKAAKLPRSSKPRRDQRPLNSRRDQRVSQSINQTKGRSWQLSPIQPKKKTCKQ